MQNPKPILYATRLPRHHFPSHHCSHLCHPKHFNHDDQFFGMEFWRIASVDLCANSFAWIYKWVDSRVKQSVEKKSTD